MDINKVNEIVADIKSEDLAEKQRQESIADDFLKDRLEYYVAQVIAGKIRNYSSLRDVVRDDFTSRLDGTSTGFEAMCLSCQRVDNELNKIGWESVHNLDSWNTEYMCTLNMQVKNDSKPKEGSTEQPKPSNLHWFLFAIIVSNFIGVLIGVCIK